MTFVELAVSFLFGFAAGYSCGYFTAKNVMLERLLSELPKHPPPPTPTNVIPIKRKK